MRTITGTGVLLALSVAAGCGRTSAPHAKSAPAHHSRSACNLNRPLTATQWRQKLRIRAIVRLMGEAKSHASESRLTDRLLLALGNSRLPLYTENQLIDLAAAAAARAVRTASEHSRQRGRSPACS